MLSRFSSLRYLAAGGASKIVATIKATPASNLLLYKEYGNKAKRPRDEDPSERSCPPSKRAKVCKEDEIKAHKNRKVAVLLAGCGKMDGSDVVEAISLAVNLDKHKYIAVDYFAIDQEMTHHWDHQNWTSMNRVRNAKHEAARLLRTAHIYDLDYLKEEIISYDGLFIPGGRGVAWNLMTLAARRNRNELNQLLRESIMDLVKEKKLIGCSSEGGILAALALEGVTITFGRATGSPDDNQTEWRARLIQEASSLNAVHESKGSLDYAYCPKYNVFSVPGHLGTIPDYNTRHRSIGLLVWTFRNEWLISEED